MYITSSVHAWSVTSVARSAFIFLRLRGTDGAQHLARFHNGRPQLGKVGLGASFAQVSEEAKEASFMGWLETLRSYNNCLRVVLVNLVLLHEPALG
jgi:hypothetical protein